VLVLASFFPVVCCIFKRHMQTATGILSNPPFRFPPPSFLALQKAASYLVNCLFWTDKPQQLVAKTVIR